MPTKSHHTRPPLKWAGNKFRLLSVIKQYLPKPDPKVRFIEPFAGSGAVFLNTDYVRNVVNDVNPDLINFYEQIKRDKTAFIRYCADYFHADYNTESAFYLARRIFNYTDDAQLKAALFLYINKHGFNGLCRYNKSGGLNVPYGKMKRPYFPEKEMLHFIEKSRATRFYCDDFTAMFRKAKKGDVIYCDPPYVPLSTTANFTDYAVNGFSLPEQEKLADYAMRYAAKGVTVIISNHKTPLTIALYQQATCYSLDVRRTISCDGQNRKLVKEIIAVFHPKDSE